MKRIRILDYLLLLHLFELPEEKMDWWARLTFIASIILFGCSLIFSLIHVDRLGILASISLFVSSILSFLVASLEGGDSRSRLLWLSTLLMLLGSTLLLAILLSVFISTSVAAR